MYVESKVWFLWYLYNEKVLLQRCEYLIIIVSWISLILVIYIEYYEVDFMNNNIRGIVIDPGHPSLDKPNVVI